MTSVTCYGGVGEIGGNKVLLEDGDSRLFFDFGIDYTKRYQYFEEYLNPRPGLGLLDFLETGLLTPLKGIYRPDLDPDGSILAAYKSSPYFRELHVDGVLLSHAHLDHSGYISFLREDIPIHCSAMTAFIAKAVQDSGKSDIEKEVCYLIPREYSFPKLSSGEDIVGALKSGEWQKVAARQRPFHLFDFGELNSKARQFWVDTPGARKLDPKNPAPVERIGDLRLKHLPLDHSVPGACAFAVETSQGCVIYTGDLRFHGKEGRLTQEFVQAAAELRPTLMICEGTNVPKEPDATIGPSFSEEEVLEKALEAVKGTRGLVIADFGPRNIERLLTFQEVAALTQRRLVVLARDAYLLEAMRHLSSEMPNLPQDSLILIYHDSKSQLDRWERGIRERYVSKLISPQQIHQAQGDHILCFSFFDINELPQIRPDEGSIYIYSSSEAHNEEQEMDLRRLHNWLRHFNIIGVGLPVEMAPGKWEVPAEEQGLHASGHASGAELLGMIREIRPKVLIPIHTEKPEYFEGLKRDGIEVCIPRYGEPIHF